jgi:hypothetical protein
MVLSEGPRLMDQLIAGVRAWAAGSRLRTKDRIRRTTVSRADLRDTSAATEPVCS